MSSINLDQLVKSPQAVIPAQAGIHNTVKLLDSRLRGNDKNGQILTFYKTLNLCKNIAVAFCGLFFVIASLSAAFSAEKPRAISSDQSGCPAILLTNENYLPALIKAIDEAQSEIFMSIFSFKAGVHKNSYPDRVSGHLAKAVKRGVDVKVILETTGKLNDELNAQNRQTGKLLEEKGVKVYFDSPRTTTHTKLIVIDERVVILGSHNLTQSALKYNNEISIMLSRPDLAKRARNYMLTIIREAK